MLPLGMFRLLRRLHAIADGRLVLLAGDKGHLFPESFERAPSSSSSSSSSNEAVAAPSIPSAALHGSAGTAQETAVGGPTMQIEMTTARAGATHGAEPGSRSDVGGASRNAGEHPFERPGFAEPHMSVHGSVSFMVNFHAIARWFHRRGGESMSTGRLEGLKVFMGWTGAPVGGCSQARLCFHQFVDPSGFSPDDFHTLQREIKAKVAAPPLRLCLSLLRLASHDSEVYWKLHRRILQTSRDPDMSVTVDRDAAIDVSRLAQTNFSVVERHDVCFEAGRWLMVLRRFDVAHRMLARSLALHGEHYVTHHNIGICKFRCGDLEGAMDSFEACLAVKPRYREARAWLERTQAKLGGGSPSGPRARGKGGGEGSRLKSEMAAMTGQGIVHGGGVGIGVRAGGGEGEASVAEGNY